MCQDEDENENEDELIAYGYLNLITNQGFVRSGQHYGLTKTKTNHNFSLEPY